MALSNMDQPKRMHHSSINHQEKPLIWFQSLSIEQRDDLDDSINSASPSQANEDQKVSRQHSPSSVADVASLDWLDNSIVDTEEELFISGLPDPCSGSCCHPRNAIARHSHHYEKGLSRIREILLEEQKTKRTSRDRRADPFEWIQTNNKMSQENDSVARQTRTAGTPASPQSKQQDYIRRTTLMVPAPASPVASRTTPDESSAVWPWILDKDGLPQPPPPPHDIDANFWTLMDYSIIYADNSSDDDTNRTTAHVLGGGGVATTVMPNVDSNNAVWPWVMDSDGLPKPPPAPPRIDSSFWALMDQSIIHSNMSDNDNSNRDAGGVPTLVIGDDGVVPDTASKGTKVSHNNIVEAIYKTSPKEPTKHSATGETSHPWSSAGTVRTKTVKKVDSDDLIDFSCFTSSTSWIDDL